MSFFQRLKACYLQTFLPFENSEHRLYCAPPEEPGEEWEDLGNEFLHAPFQIEFTTSSDPHTKHRI